MTEAIPATFDWHHSIRIAGTPPPSYVEAKKLPTFEDTADGEHQGNREEGPSVDSEGKIQTNGQLEEDCNAVVVVEVTEGTSEGASGQDTQDQTRTFTTDYTPFDTA